MSKFYTGVGSRETPLVVQEIMERAARMLAVRGWVLRSGHADGADRAFERGCDQAGGEKEIYLPWYRFNQSNSRLHRIPDWAFEQAKEIYGERWQYLKAPVKKLHARNILQVMGWSEDAPQSEFLVCWTFTGLPIGGTRTAILLAEELSIPVVNLFRGEKALEELRVWCPGL